MSYEFGSALYRCSSEMHDAIASEYMYAGGNNDQDTVDQFFAECTDEQLADDAITEWGLAENPNFDRAELITALRDLRANSR